MRLTRVLAALGVVLCGFTVKAWTQLPPPVLPWNTTPALPTLTTSPDSTAYDLSATLLTASPPLYINVFHTEANTPEFPGVLCTGDSTSVKYASTPFAGQHHYKNQDYVISKALNPDAWYQSYQSVIPPCTGLSGAGNPNLTFNGYHFWAINYLTVANRNGTGFRHHLMTALVNYGQPGADILNIFASPLYYLSNNRVSCPFGAGHVACDAMSWMFPTGNGLGAMAGRTFPMSADPTPAHEAGTLNLISSAVSYLTGNTYGLMGNMTYNAALDKLYFYYTDIVSDSGVLKMQLLRREATKFTGGGPAFHYMTEFKAPEVILSANDGRVDFGSQGPPNAQQPVNLGPGSTLITHSSYMKVGYHSALQKWVVLYMCKAALPENGPATDICMQLSDDEYLSTLHISSNDAPTFGVHIPNDALINGWGNGYRVEQFGVRKNGWGHHFRDGYGDVIVYFPVVLPGAGNTFGAHVYSKRVCVNGPC
jgi:hypothetical protein